MLLPTFIRSVYVPARIKLAREYERNLYSVARRFSGFLGRPAELRDLTVVNVCAYLANYRKAWSARSTNNQRATLISFWLDVADRAELIPLLAELPQPRRIKKLKEDREPPRCWREKQIRKLIAYLATLDGTICDITASDWWLSLVLSIHWTSSRISSMMAVVTDDYDGEGLLVRKQKNHQPLWHELPKSCRRIIERTEPNGRKMLWPSPWSMWTVWHKFREIVEEVGLPAPKGKRNLFHKLRRTTITYCAKVDPAIAQRTAGHKDYATTLRSYVDETVVRQRSAVDVLFDPLDDSPDDPEPERRLDKPIYETQPPLLRIYG